MENLTPVGASTAGPSNSRGGNSPPSRGYGKRSSIPPTVRTAELAEIIKALAILQDGLRLFVLSGGLQAAPYVNEKGILVLALKIHGHTIGVGPEGNFVVDGISVMEGRQEE